MSDCRIICLGNPLMGDDGAGPAVFDLLRTRTLPESVELIDAGTIGLGLLHLLEGAGRVILVDAVEMGLEPGTVRRFTLDEVLVDEDPSISLHQVGVAQALLLGREMGQLPEKMVLLGIQPGRVERRIGLSGPVATAAAEVAARIGDELD